MRRPEILAPAGDRDAMAAALAAGADAVYFGLDDGFNARARAENFPSDGLAEIARWVHRAGARAYVTLNTLVFEPELPVVEELIRRVAAAGIDAIIVQDPAVALLAHALSPEIGSSGRTAPLEVHASTQMTASSPLAVGLLSSLGLSRVVVPRELSVDEIRAYREGTRVELEVFVHGALCVAWSGQCLSSEAWGGRSANRGQCAQACRLPYSLVVDDVTRDLGEVEYLLSPKDLVGLDVIGALAEIGVASLKIEGRLKGPAYVATTVAQYRDAAARAVGETSPTRPVEIPLDRDSLNVAYSRGASAGFLDGANHQTLVEGRFPRHRGLPIGRVIAVEGDEVEIVRDASQRPVTGGLAVAHDVQKLGSDPYSGSRASDITEVRAGMGVVFDAGTPEQQEQGGPIFAAAATPRGYRLRFGQPGPDLGRVKPGDFVWVSSDPKVTRAGEKAAAAGREALGRIAVDLVVTGAVGSPLEVRATIRRRATHVGASAADGQGSASSNHRDAVTHVGASAADGQGSASSNDGDAVTHVGASAAVGQGSASSNDRDAVTHVGASAADGEGSASSNHRDAVTHVGASAAVHRSASPLAAARNAGITPELIADKLGAFGGTPFHLGALDTSGLAAGLHLPVSELKDVRRAVVADLETALDTIDRVVVAESVIERVRAAVSTPPPLDEPAQVVPLCRTDEQLDAVLDAGATEVELDWMELVGLAKAVDRARARGARVGIATVRVQKPGEEKIDAHLARLAPDSVLVRSWGSLAYFAALPAGERPRLHGDFSLNVTSSITAGWVLGHGVHTQTAAHDLDRDQLLAMLDAAPRGRIGVTVHHHIPTFHTEHCVYAHLLSTGRDYKTCGRPCEQHQVALRDRVGLVHPVVVDVGCRNTVFNAQAQSAASLVPDLLARGVRRFRVELVRETAEETRRVFAAYAQLVAGEIAPADVVRAASVHEQFGVTRGTMRTLTVLR